ncbi:hypothetical protein ABRC46_001991 [Salmonella enterica]|nr:hypothetical protein [Salmonella enterica]EEC3525476.1 hypothetical protein [Salmonella enterica]ELM2234542.1 hypothetical protein [Salmonella enterica]
MTHLYIRKKKPRSGFQGIHPLSGGIATGKCGIDVKYPVNACLPVLP